MTDNVVTLSTNKPPEFIFGPFTESRVMIEGRCIPKLTARDNGETVDLILDGRMSVTIPKENGYQVAWLIANALAIGMGYPSMNAETKEQPFAPKVFMIGEH